MVQENKPKKVTRDEYFEIVKNSGRVPVKGEYEIIPLDLSRFSLEEITKKIVNANFTNVIDESGKNITLFSHMSLKREMEFAKRCNFRNVIMEAYLGYAYSDEQLAFLTYCEEDTILYLFTDKDKYERNRDKAIKEMEG